MFVADFAKDQQKQIFRIVAAVLHFGNVEIVPEKHESSKIEVRAMIIYMNFFFNT